MPRAAFALAWALMLHAALALWWLAPGGPDPSKPVTHRTEWRLSAPPVPTAAAATGHPGAGPLATTRSEPPAAFAERLRQHLQARAAGLAGEGQLLLEARIGTDGRLRQLRVLATQGTVDRQQALAWVTAAEPLPAPNRELTVQIPIRLRDAASAGDSGRGA